jgi:lipoate---protein ligase
VSPLADFTSMGCATVARHMERSFAAEFHAHAGELSREELDAARELTKTKYATSDWISRLP